MEDHTEDITAVTAEDRAGIVPHHRPQDTATARRPLGQRTDAGAA